uniref:F-box domain-containing protein n=1 Tax=Timema bartmani TaxID=61472 RepID=A0A7R9FBW8_9NEOP|nr:unnamed protein product [Timema bartmani]
MFAMSSPGKPDLHINEPQNCINDLPNEVLEYVFNLVSPYEDLKNCSLVCKKWYLGVQKFRVICTRLPPPDLTFPIAKRYSHSTCVHENCMYVFGGCTSTSTTFNDLWSLNLNERCWLRPLTMGNYPTPKACATLVSYQDKLFLFGGWSHPSPYPIFQAWKLFNELHVYNIESKRWSSMVHSTEPPAMAGHSATIQGHLMVVFGGLHKTGDHGIRTNSNDVWCYDIENLVWTKQATTDNRPAARFGQSQVSLDKTSLIILGNIA